MGGDGSPFVIVFPVMLAVVGASAYHVLTRWLTVGGGGAPSEHSRRGTAALSYLVILGGPLLPVALRLGLDPLRRRVSDAARPVTSRQH